GLVRALVRRGLVRLGCRLGLGLVRPFVRRLVRLGLVRPFVRRGLVRLRLVAIVVRRGLARAAAALVRRGLVRRCLVRRRFVRRRLVRRRLVRRGLVPCVGRAVLRGFGGRRLGLRRFACATGLVGLFGFVVGHSV